MTAAFAGGMVLKGKSGWCSTMCPLLPVQRIYGQTPFTLVANAHCQPCVGCAKNCYDFNPRAAYLADLNDNDGYWAGYRRFFVGAFPGLVLGVLRVTGRHDVVAGCRSTSPSASRCSRSLTTFFKVSAHTITSTLRRRRLRHLLLVRRRPARARHVARCAPPRSRSPPPGSCARWRKEKPFLAQAAAPDRARRRHRRRRPLDRAPAAPQVRRARGHVRPRGQARRRPSRASAAGDRRGQRDDDRGRLPDGHLRRRPRRDQGRDGAARRRSPTTRRPRSTGSALRRTRGWRAACASPGRSRSRSSPTRRRRRASARSPASTTTATVGSVVVIGNGIAGVTAADHLRRRHPADEIDLIAEEPHHLYNRMGICAARLRPLRHAGALPEPGRLVRRAQDHGLAEHPRAGDRPRAPRGLARHGRAAAATTG